MIPKARDTASPPGDDHASEIVVSASVRLGLEIRRYRMLRGVSQRQLTQGLGLSARSNLSDYELGRRTPPRDIVVACESLLETPSGYLLRWYWEALAQRADEWFKATLARGVER